MHLSQFEPTQTLDMGATSENERAYWQSRAKAAISAPVEIDVNAFHNAAGMLPPMINWRCDTAQDTESFMLADMYCENVTDVYVRCGKRYFHFRDYCNTNHADIVGKVKMLFRTKSESQI